MCTPNLSLQKCETRDESHALQIVRKRPHRETWVADVVPGNIWRFLCVLQQFPVKITLFHPAMQSYYPEYLVRWLLSLKISIRTPKDCRPVLSSYPYFTVEWYSPFWMFFGGDTGLETGVESFLLALPVDEGTGRHELKPERRAPRTFITSVRPPARTRAGRAAGAAPPLPQLPLSPSILSRQLNVP